MASPGQRDNKSGFRRGVRWMVVSRKTGRVTLAQWPNLALWVFIATLIAQQFCEAIGPLETTLRILGTIALIVWASDEIARGVNPFRRILGAAVLALTIAGLVG